ncbi:MAG: AURKAIP1/COX24 domain-containing protein [Bacteroidales bacterium]|nr:AURKAIP1/COX24 domain-containing protein [Bacteroidales bacterium]
MRHKYKKLRKRSRNILKKLRDFTRNSMSNSIPIHETST